MKILIADDEDYTREGLVEHIDWDKFGIKEVVQARNGNEAKNIAMWYQPDIVLTDIKMPKLDGISFANELEKINPLCMLIFMSGYMEIDYLKSAIKLSAVDFIEKPINLIDVENALEKAINSIQERRNLKVIKEDRKELLQQKVANILISKDFDYNMIKRMCSEINFPINRSYCCIILGDHNRSSNAEEVVNSFVDSYDQKKIQVIGNCIGDYRYSFIVAFVSKERYRINSILQIFLTKNIGYSVGIGIDTNNIRGIYNSYQTAQIAYNYSFYDEENRMFYIDEKVMEQKNLQPGLYGEFISLLKENPYNLKEWVDNIFNNLKKDRYYRKEQVQALIVSMIEAIIQENVEIANENSYLKDSGNIELLIHKCGRLSEIREIIFDILTKLENKCEEQSQYSRLIKGVINYVGENYKEADLSVGQIADYFHFSSAYLSVLFKQEMKVPLKQYISNYRISKAKQLLEDEFNKVTEIAIMCGYANSNYFAKVFKEITGMTPIEYREEKVKY